MDKKYIVRLTDEEREQLSSLVRRGQAAAYKIRHANILLNVDREGFDRDDQSVAQSLHCHANTVRNVRQRFVEQGLDAALERKKQDRPSRSRHLDGAQEARLIALSCSPPPEGRAQWTLRLLADRLVEMKVVDSISHETVRQTLKKTNSSRIYANAG